MRIVQITDIHIGTMADKPHGIDLRDQFLRTLQKVMTVHPDCIVISGDLCFREPSDEIYKWIGEQVQALPCPVFVIAGNHDSQSIMHHYFDCDYHQDTDEIYFAKTWLEMPVLFCDTARGVISENQYHWMEKHLELVQNQVILFMHHPPAYCGVPYLDTSYAFREIPRLQDFFKVVGKDIVIFCGHYHVERELLIANQHIYITPSTFFQIDATESEFKIDHHRPGYRVIELDARGTLHSTCSYL